MELTTDGKSLKIVGMACHALSKIGDAAFIECSERGGFSLRSLNSCRSAFLLFKFHPSYFRKVTQTNNEQHSVYRYKLSVKSLQVVFKNLQSFERNVDNCLIVIDKKSNLLKFQVTYTYGLI